MMSACAVIFDCGGVLFEFDQERRLEVLSQASGLAPSSLQERIWDSGLDSASDHGKLAIEQICRRLNEALEQNLSEEVLADLMTSAFALRPEVLDLARRLKSDVLRGTLTNNGPLIDLGLRRNFPELGEVIPENRYFSYQFKAAKPEPAVYHALEVRLGLAGPEILLIDDSDANIEGARRAGWQVIEFHDSDSLARELGELGLLTEET
jgi:putative hydrolase of the HAD superfamily